MAKGLLASTVGWCLRAPGPGLMWRREIAREMMGEHTFSQQDWGWRREVCGERRG